MLPQMDGFELMDFITPLHIPVIFLTAKNGVADRVKGLRMGAEDYIVKPFDVMELLARVEVVLRRYNKSQEQLSFLDIEIDIRSMRVMKQEIEVSLTPKEYELLLLFARNPNTALYRETIYERVWGGELEYGSKTVDLHVQRLRKKLGLEQELQAINKVGYRFEVKG
jgi:DNA-binding response OmpR family regulator